MKQEIGIMVAVDKNWRIGGEFDFPLGKLETNIRWLTAIASEATIIFGRKTYESVVAFDPLVFRRPFIVLSRNCNLKIKGSMVCNSFRKSLEVAHGLNRTKEIIAVGGEEIFREFFPLASRLFIAQSEQSKSTRGKSPISRIITLDKWRTGRRECHNLGGDKTQQSFSFITYEKRIHPAAV